MGAVVGVGEEAGREAKCGSAARRESTTRALALRRRTHALGISQRQSMARAAAMDVPPSLAALMTSL